MVIGRPPCHEQNGLSKPKVTALEEADRRRPAYREGPVHTTARKPLQSHKAHGLTGVIRVPGDKSMSHRSLMLGAVAMGETEIKGLLEAEDVLNTAKAMNALGADVQKSPDGSWHIHGVGVSGLMSPETPLDFGNSGTGVRLAVGLMATTPLTARLTGDASLIKRPMGRV